MDEEQRGSRLDRRLQRRILESLREHYPGQVGPEDLDLGLTQDDRSWNVNAHYLREHGLIEALAAGDLGGPALVAACITAKGMDFLEDDGGLSAILGVVTVQFEEDTLRALLAAKIDASGLPAEKKSAIKARFSEMGTEALKEVTQRFVTMALERWPEALQALEAMTRNSP